MESEGRHVFSQPRNPDKKLDPWVLESQMERLHDKIKTDPDAGLHTLRHALLTEAGVRSDQKPAQSAWLRMRKVPTKTHTVDVAED